MKLLSHVFDNIQPINYDDLPHNLHLDTARNVLMYTCTCCGNDFDLDFDFEDITEDTQFYCGSSPRCCP